MMLAVIDWEESVPPDHAPRAIKAPVDRALAELSSTFDAFFSSLLGP